VRKSKKGTAAAVPFFLCFRQNPSKKIPLCKILLSLNFNRQIQKGRSEILPAVPVSGTEE